MNKKEQRRLMVLNQVEGGGVAGRQAAEVLGLSLRQVRRLLAAYRKEGAAALAHGNRGRKPPHTIPELVRTGVRGLAQGRYRGLNHCHLTELLAEREGLVLSRSTVRHILAAAGVNSPRRRRAPQHRIRRERYPQEGMLLQLDGSRHDWLEGRGPWLTLVAAIDDATGHVPYARFREQEDAQGYFLLLREVIRSQGIPMALYSDRHGIFQRSPREPESLEEQLAGERSPTQFGRALRELGIAAIFAHSPQAKGRIERLFGTFQDRLVSELRLAGVSTVEQANRVLEHFLPRYNARFAVPAAQEGAAYQPLPEGVDLEGVLCFKYRRTVGPDNVVRFGGQRLQLLPSNGRASYARARVEVQERLDGSLAVYYQGRCLATREAPAEASVLRARNMSRAAARATPASGRPPPARGARHTPALKVPRPTKPSPDHPWRRPFKVHLDRG